MEANREAQQQALRALDQLNIPYELIRHPAAGTIDEIAAMGIQKYGEIPKNLFLQDHSGRHLFLLVIRSDKRADLKAIARQLLSSRLCFASEERLEQCLGLKKGAVTPLGLIHESGRAVKVLFDRDLKGLERAGFHPNDNHATVFLRFQDLCRLLEAYGHPCRFLTV